MFSLSWGILRLVGRPVCNAKESPAKFKDFRPPFNNEPADYKKMLVDHKEKRDKMLSHPERFQRIRSREDRSDWPAVCARLNAKGKFLTRYRGFEIWKNPEDFVLYHQLFLLAKPATVIELGTLSGGMSIWIADTLKLLDLSSQVYSMDIDPSLRSEAVDNCKPESVVFLQGDCYAIEKIFTAELLSELPHPWIFIDDAHANMRGVLEYFHKFFQDGDYVVVEDTNPNIAVGLEMGVIRNDEFKLIGSKSLNCLQSFLRDFEDYYAVDTFITDFFGYNCSWHWHGFIRRMK